MLTDLGTLLALYLPAMIANGTPVVVMRSRKGHPLDCGKFFIDKRRILGDSKTVEGLISGVISGSLIGFLVGILLLGGHELETMGMTALASSSGAMIGDLVKSFFKRRMGIESGGKLPLADQLDFYLGATVFLLIIPGALKPSLTIFFEGLIIIPLLHILTNRLAYKLGLKRVPY